MSYKNEESLKVVEKLRVKLSQSIKAFCATKSDNYTQADFAKDVDEAMNLSTDWYHDADERAKRAKNVSRWINKEVFPNTELLIGISKVLGVSVNELFEGVFFGNSKTKMLSETSKKVLKLLLDHRSKNNNGDFVSSLYFPYAYNGKVLCTDEKVYAYEEVIEMYKKYTEEQYRMERMQEFSELLQKNPQINKQHFSRFCSCCILENEGEGDIERIAYNGSQEVYQQLQSVWAKEGRQTFYNVLYYEMVDWNANVKQMEYYPWLVPDVNGESETDSLDAFYKSQAKIERVCEQFFKELLEREIIVKMPGEDFILDEEGCLRGKHDENFDCYCSIVDSDGTSKGGYHLDMREFYFQIKLTEAEMKQFYQEEIENMFRGNQQ